MTWRTVEVRAGAAAATRSPRSREKRVWCPRDLPLEGPWGRHHEDHGRRCRFHPWTEPRFFRGREAFPTSPWPRRRPGPRQGREDQGEDLQGLRPWSKNVVYYILYMIYYILYTTNAAKFQHVSNSRAAAFSRSIRCRDRALRARLDLGDPRLEAPRMHVLWPSSLYTTPSSRIQSLVTRLN